MLDPGPLRRFALLLIATSLAVGSPAVAAVKVMFVTSASGTGNLHEWPNSDGLSGLAAGDRICQNLAADAGLAHSADFRAWLSTGATDAFCHVAGFSGKKANDCGQTELPNAGPWVRVDGKPFSNRLQALTTGHAVLWVPSLDERGATVAYESVHTGTYADGTAAASGEKCNNWSDGSMFAHEYTGVADTGAISWTGGFGQDCLEPARLYCFESGSGDALPSYGDPGAYMFVTSASGPGNLAEWSESGGVGGLAGADAVCRTEARAGGLPAPDSFVAWLSTGAVDAADRLGTEGPWRRPGGVEIAPDRATLLGTGPFEPLLESDVEVDNLGNHEESVPYTGTYRFGLGTGYDCAGWTSSDPGDSGTIGWNVAATGAWSEPKSLRATTTSRSTASPPSSRSSPTVSRRAT